MITTEDTDNKDLFNFLSVFRKTQQNIVLVGFRVFDRLLFFPLKVVLFMLFYKGLNIT